MTEIISPPGRVTVAVATRKGTEINNADAAAVFTSEVGVTGAAVIDIAGHHPAAPEVACLLAETAARIAPQRSVREALLSAGLLVADAGGADLPEPDGVGVVATVNPETGLTVIAWVGDPHALSWDGRDLLRITTPHTYGEQLRCNGAPWEVAEDHDNWLLTTLGRAVPASVFVVSSTAPVIILASDGIDAIEPGYLEGLVISFADDPQRLANGIVLAAPIVDGYRDDTTAIVLAVNAPAPTAGKNGGAA